jgi:hypothetical protein
VPLRILTSREIFSGSHEGEWFWRRATNATPTGLIPGPAAPPAAVKASRRQLPPTQGALPCPLPADATSPATPSTKLHSAPSDAAAGQRQPAADAPWSDEQCQPQPTTPAPAATAAIPTLSAEQQPPPAPASPSKVTAAASCNERSPDDQSKFNGCRNMSTNLCRTSLHGFKAQVKEI